MKTAEEWLPELCPCCSIECANDTDDQKSVIRQIQADVMEHALAIALELNDGHEWPITRRLEEEIGKLRKP